MNKTSRQKNKNQQEVNKWKWAFISLVTILLLVFFLFVRALMPISIEEREPQALSPTDDKIELSSALSKEDAEFIMNSYLNVQADSDSPSYQIEIEEELKFASTVNLLGLELPFILTFDPYATEEGNLQLRAKSMDLASLSLPVSAVLSALGSQMDLPDYIQIDSDEKMILVDFNELENYYPYGIELEKVDLETDEIRLKLSVNKDTLKRALDSEENLESDLEKNKD